VYSEGSGVFMCVKLGSVIREELRPEVFNIRVVMRMYGPKGKGQAVVICGSVTY
jgi:hypothetical protein